MQQTTNRVFMVRPAAFGFNLETAETNVFQNKAHHENVIEKAQAEFDEAVYLLRSVDVEVTVFKDTEIPKKPDAVFPNNWISTHANGQLFLYPMCAPNRRFERNPGFIEHLVEEFAVRDVIDLSDAESTNAYLEGTGSMIFDRENHLAYGCYSERTHAELFQQFCETIDYRPIGFHAVSKNGFPIYHTNVLMCLGKGFVVICMDAIHDEDERSLLFEMFGQTGKTLISISEEQMNSFAGNMLQLTTSKGEFIVLSQTAFDSLNATQIELLETFGQLLALPISTIESIGGGSARCMIAENFLPLKP